MSFLHRRRSLQGLHIKEKESKQATSKPVSLIPASAAIENVPQKGDRYRTTSTLGASHIIRRVSSIFTPRKNTPRKKAPPNLTLVDSALETNSRPRSFSSSRDSLESEDDIRRPSGLGSAVSLSIHSNRSLPPSPFSPTGPQESYNAYSIAANGEYQRTRAISSPNLLRSLSWKVRAKVKARHASIAPSPTTGEQPQSPLSPRFSVQFPEEIVVLIMSHLSQHSAAISAPVSKTFAAAARKTLYGSLDFDSLSPIQAERLIAQLASRRDLTDLVTNFVCRAWPPFFLSDAHGQPTQNSRVFKHQDALLTATFTLALERMSNLHSLTLPSFDMSLLSHHSAFGLKSLTFLNHTSTDAETKAIFAWLDGQVNITCLRFPNLEDTPPKTSDIPHHYDDTQPTTAPPSPFLRPFPTNGLSPHASPLSSPRSVNFHPPSTPPSPADTLPPSTLLPNLTTLHATPTLVMLLSNPPESSPRRPLTSVILNINTTLYNGLRPATLMCALKGITHLALRFSDNVDKRSFEKVVGAAGASLGLASKSLMGAPFTDSQTTSSTERFGLRSLEISFPRRSSMPSGREEALYKSLHASLARYKTLSSLRLFVDFPKASQTDEEDTKDDTPSALELILITSWAKLCPTLQSITLFSGARWQGATQPLQKTQPESKVFKFP